MEHGGGGTGAPDTGDGGGGSAGREADTTAGKPVFIVPATIGHSDGPGGLPAHDGNVGAGGARSTGPVVAVAQLLFRPGRFFAWFGGEERLGGLVWLLMYVATVAGSIDRFSVKTMLGTSNAVLDNWAMYWGVMLVAGAFGTLFTLGIWVGLFRLRLLFCGLTGQKAFWRSARIWSAARAITAVPAIGVAVVESVVFRRPSEAVFSESMWYMLVLPLPFWSVYASYRGVRVTFPALNRWWVRLWFLAFPGGLIALVLVGLAALSMLGSWPEPPDLDRTRAYESPSLRFEYPGNWRLMDAPGEHEAGRLVQIETAQGTYVSLALLPAQAEAGVFFEIRSDQLAEAGVSLEDEEPLNRLGRFEGTGWRAEFDELGVRYVLEHLVVELTPYCWLEIESMAPRPSRGHVADGRARMLGTLDVTPLDELSIEAGGSLYYTGEWCALSYPGEWFLDDSGGSALVIEPWQDGALVLMVYESSVSARDEVGATLDGLVADAAPETVDTLERWAGLAGEGVVVRYASEGDQRQMLVFVHELNGGRMFEVQASCAVDDLPLLEDGFGFVERNFELHADEPSEGGSG